MKDPRIIKRYPNRKLYDTSQSTYVTLPEIGNLVQKGEEVVIIDNKTGKDITSATLTQFVFEKQKRTKGPLPLETLRDIIQTSRGSLSKFLQKGWELSLNSAEKTLQQFLPKKQFRFVKEVIDLPQKSIDDIYQRVDERIKTTIQNLTGLNKIYLQIGRLNKKIEILEKKLNQIENQK